MGAGTEMATDLYLGYRNDDAETSFGKFFKPEMASLPQHVVEALQHGSQGAMALSAFEDAAGVAGDGYQQTENVRSTPSGAEMRSRFWMGGSHVALRNAPDLASRAMRSVASRILGNPEANARNLMVHCAQEMNHLAGFLPELYEAFGGE